MEITFNKTQPNEGVIKINISRADFQSGVDQKIKEHSKKAEIKGFRKGKVPVGMIKKMYGTALIIDEINKLVSDKLNNYLKENETQFLGEPLPSSEDNSYDWDNQEEFEFSYDIGYADPFELKLDKKKLEKYFIKVDEQVINETIDNLQRQFGETENTEVSVEGDIIKGEATINDIELTKEISIDFRDLEKTPAKKLTGINIGDVVDLDIKKTFKHTNVLRSQIELNEEKFDALKGKFQFTVKSIEHPKLAEVNQEFYDKTFGKDTVKSQEEFIEKVKEAVSKNYEGESENFFNYQIREKLAEDAKIALPDEFLKKWLTKTNEKLTPELLEFEYANYAKELKWSLIRNKIVADSEIKVEHEDVLNEAKKMIKAQFGSMGMGDQMDAQLDSFANNYLQGENGENYMKVFNQAQNDKVLAFIKENASIKEKTVSLEEFRKL